MEALVFSLKTQTSGWATYFPQLQQPSLQLTCYIFANQGANFYYIQGKMHDTKFPNMDLQIYNSKTSNYLVIPSHVLANFPTHINNHFLLCQTCIPHHHIINPSLLESHLYTTVQGALAYRQHICYANRKSQAHFLALQGRIGKNFC